MSARCRALFLLHRTGSGYVHMNLTNSFCHYSIVAEKNFLIAFFTPSITSEIGFRYVCVFASCNLLGSLIVYLFLYESAGMPLEMVDLVRRSLNIVSLSRHLLVRIAFQMYRDASVTPRTSRRWYPRGCKSEAAEYHGGENVCRTDISARSD